MMKWITAWGKSEGRRREGKEGNEKKKGIEREEKKEHMIR